MAELTKKERNVMSDLDRHARKCMRSRFVLAVLSDLSQRNLIEFDPFAGTAKLTEAGRDALHGRGM